MPGFKAPDHWFEPRGWKSALLAPLGFAYGRAARWRMDKAEPITVDAPVICIGNVTVGGTGKTPTAIALAHAARKQGYAPGIVSRGYGGIHKSAHLVDAKNDAVRNVGDEALLLARVAPTVIGANRAKSAELLIENGCDFLLMDDGFQSQKLYFDYGLITIDARRGIGNGHCIPAGPLRAPLRDQMRMCDAVVRIGYGDAGDEVVRAAARAAKPVMSATLKPANVREISQKKVLAFAGIGDPQKFFDTLSTYGCWLSHAVPFGDHHMFTPADAQKLLTLADSEGLELVTTEKDHVRLIYDQGPLGELKKRSHVLPVSLVFEAKSDALSIIQAVERSFDDRRLKKKL
ncbi:MAG: tetraacyldisaccharide 4'-kinase [Pseudomonadota bacterium]